ncbi:hypothetical protein CAI21_15585 [Alkalilimnicola ehrlichii]|uniref:GGDEF domain-containing protein n=1 Tax=Alkalilimnicola ehrlichii TaxID=351052 RepID=A0A3E0WMC1_9GAMM|nr:GGDEF domain-containing protein [Alkalilimnicola ehrlichii]RFA26984.1 hypothetical protein CAI21_15585 [Alkalilimnicola ehrlichii]RFA34104.1 hypothetical protein CAL65_15720 [Alkalilimnicola ehrlichii]
MVVDFAFAQESRLRAPLYAAVHILVWIVLVALLGAHVWSGQLRQAEDEFQLHAATLHREMSARLEASEAVLAGVVVFLQVHDPEVDAPLRHFSRELLPRFPHIYQVVVGGNAIVSVPSGLEDKVQQVGQGAAEANNLSPSEMPITFTEPSRVDSRIKTGGTFGTLTLRGAVEQAAQRGSVVASRPFALRYGDLAYALVHPLESANGAEGEGGFVLLKIRAKDLLPADDRLLDGTRVALRYEPDNNESGTLLLVGREWREPGWVGRYLFPMLRFNGTFDAPSQPFSLVVERQLGWELLATPSLITAALAGVLGLALVIAYTRLRLRQEEISRRSAQRLYWLANYDTLTGLPNRNLLQDRLQQALSRARRHNYRVAVLFCDLDGFKAVNDTAGHEVGDRLLVTVAKRLQASLRDQDTVGRLSGDEFVVVLEDVTDRNAAERVVEELQRSLDEGISIDEFDFMVSASIGLALYPDDGKEADALLRRADYAMYSRKHPDWVAPPDACQ